MAFNSVSYKDALVARSDFISHPLFLKDGGWAKEGSGHVLASKSAGEDLVGVIVGKVSPHRLQCSPVGNYQVDSKVQPDFTKAKFQFTLDSPDELALKATFRSAVSSLLRLQNNISTTGSNKNLVEGEGDTASVHFSTKIFNKRPFDVVDPKPLVYLSDLENPTASKRAVTPIDPDAPTEVDAETDNWRVPNDYQRDLCALKRTHIVQPLRAYLDGNFIEPIDVNRVLTNALAQVHFSMKHFRIQRPGQNAFDSFTGEIEEVHVLKIGVPKARSAYKRSNPRSGPLDVKRMKHSEMTTEMRDSADAYGSSSKTNVGDPESTDPALMPNQPTISAPQSTASDRTQSPMVTTIAKPRHDLAAKGGHAASSKSRTVSSEDVTKEPSACDASTSGSSLERVINTSSLVASSSSTPKKVDTQIGRNVSSSPATGTRSGKKPL